MDTYVFANQKGGVGKTTVTLGIAAELAVRRARVLLVGLDAARSLPERTKATQRRASHRWRDPDSNRGHHDFQSCALPTELSRRGRADRSGWSGDSGRSPGYPERPCSQARRMGRGSMGRLPGVRQPGVQISK